MQSAIEKENIEVQELNLLTAGTVPEDASCLMINAPQKDFSDDETSAILTYLQNGGHAFLVSGYTTTEIIFAILELTIFSGKPKRNRS